MRTRKNQRGQTLIEALVVVGVVVLLVTGVVSATISSPRNTQSAKIRSQAVLYAREGIELARKKRDESWTTFLAMQTGPGQQYCLGDDQQFTLGVDCTGNVGNSFFARSATFVWSESDGHMDVTITVSWDSGGDVQQITLPSTFTNWQ